MDRTKILIFLIILVIVYFLYFRKKPIVNENIQIVSFTIDENGDVEVKKKDVPGTTSIQKVDTFVNDVYAGKYTESEETIKNDKTTYGFIKNNIFAIKDGKIMNTRVGEKISLSTYIIVLTLNKKNNNMPKPVFKFNIDEKRREELEMIDSKI
jgi:hypothetical protein